MTLGQRVLSELEEFAILTAYLWLVFASVVFVRVAALHAYGIGAAFWGVAIVKALVLAKFLMIGDLMGVGERFHGRPLIYPVLWKACSFLGLLVALTIVEEVIVGLVHHRTADQAIGDLVGPHLEQSVATILAVFLALVPLFAFRVLSERLGQGVLARMFFVDPT
jgi:hypothetical protein